MRLILLALLAVSLYANYQGARYATAMETLATCGASALRISTTAPYRDECIKLARSSQNRDKMLLAFVFPLFVTFTSYPDDQLDAWYYSQPR